MLRTGQTFAGLRIVGSLGVGPAGETYLVKPPREHREDILLLLPEARGADPAYRRAFFTAAAQAAALDHPAVVAVRGHGEDEGRLWIATEYLPAPTTEALIDQSGPLDPREAATAVVAVAGALDQARSRGLARTRVAPSDVIAVDTPEGRRYRVTGFGIPDTGAPAGERADQAALGELAAFLLGGGAAAGRGVRTMRPELPAAVDDVLARVQRPPAERYDSAGAFAAALATALLGDEGAALTEAGSNTTTIIGGASAARDPGPTQPGPTQPGPTQPVAQPPGPYVPVPPGQVPGANHPPTMPAYAAAYPPGYGPGGAVPPGYGPGGPVPPGGPGGPVPPGSSGDPGGKRTTVLIAGGVLVILIVVVGVILALVLPGGGDESTTAANSSSATTSATTSSTSPSTSTAADPAVVAGVPTACVPGRGTVRGTSPNLEAGPIRIPASALPRGWQPDVGGQLPFLVRSDGIVVARPAGESWQAQLLVGTLPTNFTGDLRAIGRKLIECLPSMPGYTGTGARPAVIDSEREDHPDNSDMQVLVFRGKVPVSRGAITSDDFVMLIADTTPRSISLGYSADNDPLSRGEVDRAVGRTQVQTR